MSGQAQTRAGGVGVGFVYRDATCGIDASAHRHIKLAPDVYLCERLVTWCPRCGVPRESAEEACAGCEHMDRLAPGWCSLTRDDNGG